MGLSTKLDATPEADFNVNNNQIMNLALPTANEGAASKKYLDGNFLALAGMIKMLATLDVDGNSIMNLPDSLADNTSAVNKKYVTAEKQPCTHKSQ